MGRTLTMTLDVPDGEFTFDPKAIVGIVGNAVHESIREPIRPIVYLPIAQEPLQSLFVAGAFIAVRSEAASPERLSRSLAAALRERGSRCAGVVPHRHGRRGLRACAGSPGGPPGDFRWSARLVAHGSRTGWRDGVPGHAITPRTRGSRRAREHTQPAGRAGPLACAATRGRGASVWDSPCGRHGWRSRCCSASSPVTPGRLRRRRRHDHCRRCARRLGTGVSGIPARPGARADPNLTPVNARCPDS